MNMMPIETLSSLPFGKIILSHAIDCAAAAVNAKPAEIPGLWAVPGYPELTTNQLLQIAARG